MSNEYALPVKQALKASRLIINTISNNKEWGKEHENLYRSLAHELIMQYSYNKEK